MKWVIMIMFAAAGGLIAWGNSIVSGGGSADERVGGTVPILAGLALGAVAIAVTLIWLVLTHG